TCSGVTAPVAGAARQNARNPPRTLTTGTNFRRTRISLIPSRKEHDRGAPRPTPGSVSRESRIDDDIGGDPDRALQRIPLAVQPLVALQGAADVVFRVDHRPMPVQLHSLKLRIVLASARRLAVLNVRKVVATYLSRVNLVITRDRNQRIVRKHLRHEP